MNVSIKRSEIDIWHRMANNKSDQPKPIIGRFRSYNAKRDLYAARKHLRGIDPGECFEGREKIYINENLTRYRRDLFAKARRQKKKINIGIVHGLSMASSLLKRLKMVSQSA